MEPLIRLTGPAQPPQRPADNARLANSGSANAAVLYL